MDFDFMKQANTAHEDEYNELIIEMASIMHKVRDGSKSTMITATAILDAKLMSVVDMLAIYGMGSREEFFELVNVKLKRVLDYVKRDM